MTPQERKVMKLVLDALTWADAKGENWEKAVSKAMKAAQEALAQPEQEPVAVKHMMEWVDYLKRKSDYGQHLQIPSEMSAGACWDLARELEQFITTPPKLTPLTDEEIKEASLKAGMQEHYMGFHSGFIRFARAIEAAHGIKE